MGVERVVTKEVRTNYYLGTCDACVLPVRVKLSHGRPSGRIACPECARVFIVKRLSAVTTEERCADACETATGPYCSCACGGSGHGSAWRPGQRDPRTELKFTEALAKIREKKAKAKASAERRKVAAFDAWAADWAELVAYLTTEYVIDKNLFLDDMRRMVLRREILSHNRAVAADKAMRQQRQWDAERVAEKAAEPAPSAVVTGRIEITGKIVGVKKQENFRTGGVIHKMLVLDDRGFKVWGTIPASLSRLGQGEDFAQRGDRVTFTASVESTDDPTFGRFSRPIKGRILRDELVAA